MAFSIKSSGIDISSPAGFDPRRAWRLPAAAGNTEQLPRRQHPLIAGTAGNPLSFLKPALFFSKEGLYNGSIILNAKKVFQHPRYKLDKNKSLSYIADTGLRNYLLGYRGDDTGHALENIVYFELLRKGYDVAIGKMGTKEIDFIATKADDKKYIQVTERMETEQTRERELAPLRMVPDNFEKMVILLDPPCARTEDGIRLVSVFDFLLD